MASMNQGRNNQYNPKDIERKTREYINNSMTINVRIQMKSTNPLEKIELFKVTKEES